MWDFLTSFWNTNRTAKENDLSLEDASNILEEDTETTETTFPETDSTIVKNFLTRSGIITKREGNTFFIDDLYKFKSEIDFPIGAKVSFNVFISDGRENIIDVNLVEGDWDEVETSDGIWSNRVIVCKVRRQVNRTLILTPGDVVLDLNEVPMHFLPVVGDWVELDVKCAVNEDVVNLAGKVVEINKVLPVRAHIVSGKVISWNTLAQTGVMNGSIFLEKYSLSCGYVPAAGDKVTAEIIESDQGQCSWRALRVVPDNNTRESEKLGCLDNFPEYVVEHPDLEITVPIVSFKNLNERKQFDVSISNKSNAAVYLESVEFVDRNRQCKVLKPLESNVVVFINSVRNVSCECTSKNVGASTALLLIKFQNVTIGRWVTVKVGICYEPPTSTWKPSDRLYDDRPSGNELMRGRRALTPPRFTYRQLPNYAVPDKLNNIMMRYYPRDPLALAEELKVVTRCFFANLTFSNFSDKFHYLLYLEELANLKMIRNYDQDKACFIPCEDFLLLEIENLSERRPSIIVGDRIIATNPLSKNGVDYEGCVHRVASKHVYLKFSRLFHDNYNGEDYSIKVIPSRASYRKLHHSVSLAPKNLGGEVLFPKKVNEKPVQVECYEEEPSGEDITTSPTSNRRLSQLEVLKRLKEISTSKNYSSNGLGDGKKLEWYNKQLNPKQKDAVKNVLMGKARPLPYIIFGPPGTGKTVTIIEMVLQILRMIPESRLLITAPSNSASDLLAFRLIDSGVFKPGDLVRLLSYNYAISDNIPVKLVPYCATSSQARAGTQQSVKTNSGILLDCSRATLGRHRVTVSTCSMAGQLYNVGLPTGHFSHIIVDEAGQASEPEVLIPLSFLDKNSGQIILAGDPMQLGPVVLCSLAGECGLNDSYLERLINRFPYQIDPRGFPDTSGYDPRLVTKLLYNYRSLPDILKLTSSLFYNDELIPTIDDETSDEAAFVEKLADILPRTISDRTPRLVFHGVNGENFQSFDSPSWYNPHEAAQVFFYTNELYRLGVTASELGIITPYIKQVKEIRSLLAEAEFDIPKIGTVEEFQGQEFKIIILSTVRSRQEYVPTDLQHSLGFITSPRRLNVAVSRAKSLLIIVGNPNLLSLDIYWRSVLKYCLENGSYTGCDILT